MTSRNRSREAFLLALTDALSAEADPREIERIAVELLAEHLGVPAVTVGPGGAWPGRVSDGWTAEEAALIAETRERAEAAADRARAIASLRTDEQRLRQIIESLTDHAISTIDSGGRVTSWNDGARRLTGYAAEEILGEHIVRLYLPEDAGRLAAAMQRAESTGRSEDESWRVRRDGSLVWVNTVMTPLRSADGRHLGFTRVSRDLTERKAFDDLLRRGQEQLERSVLQRTSEIRRTNSKLRREVAERRAGEAQIKALFERLISIQEEERRRIAREIHDHLGQQLTALRMNLAVAHSRLDGDPVALAQAQRTAQLAEDLDRSIDFLTWELRPAALDQLGLSAALQQLVDGWSERFGIAARLDVSGDAAARFAPEVEANLYRIVQEALHNVVKHADATHVTVVLDSRSDETCVVIADDGCGFDVASFADDGHHLGLISMRERAAVAGGALEIDSTAGAGTVVTVRIPAIAAVQRV